MRTDQNHTDISTLAPLAGSDACRPRQRLARIISTLAPLAGSDEVDIELERADLAISTLAPLAGSDNQGRR